MAKDYYKVLGIPRNATKEDVKKAYRTLAHKFHPDKAGGDETRFKEINEAYQVLSDDKKRGQYDRFGQVFEGGAGGHQGGFEWPGGTRFDMSGDGAGGFGDFDFADIFEDFFGGSMAREGRKKSQDRRGKDVQIEMNIPFAESILGGKREIELTKIARCPRCEGSGGEPKTGFITCPTCQGRGNVQRTQRTFLGSFAQVSVCVECIGSGKRPEKPCVECRGRGVASRQERLEIFIPKGVREGEVLKISGKGEASLTGGPPGDLYIQLHVMPHDIFRRQGDDIVMVLPIKLSQALLGDTIEVKTLDGVLRMKIPEGTQASDLLKVRGKGVYTSSGYSRGDLLVEIKIEIPKKLSKKIKELVAVLREEGM
ncbi:MAG: molecular chaperone DnaJ [Parcubacteria group bacterium Gr01-1014_66]|nr:MAG: molecular chaperone DnaJ [Parcubacteria group bacterium Gr01-1014_66]